MKNILFFILIGIYLISCDKNKELIRYSEYYHSDGNDTVSAIYIPNTMTNNWDLQNDYFKIIGFGLTNCKMDILNKNGECIFSTATINQPWDGTFRDLANENGVYHYWVKATDTSNYEYSIEGVINLLR